MVDGRKQQKEMCNVKKPIEMVEALRRMARKK
jgi:hypothetical protein